MTSPADMHRAIDLIANGALAQRLADMRPGITATRYDRQGGRPGDHADPTPNAIGRNTESDDWLGYTNAVRMIEKLTDVILRLDRNTTPTAHDRPTLWKACRRGWIHQPDIEGERCTVASCGKKWPCNENETESWWEPCKGTIEPDSALCTICQGNGRSWVCRDCGDVFTDGIDGPARNERCERDDRRVRRAAAREDAA